MPETKNDTLAQSPEDIAAKILEIGDSGEDMFGWTQELLISYLPFEHARPWLKDEITEEAWEKLRLTDPRQDCIDYLGFAWQKARNERGISANRSVDKIEAWLWLMGDTDLLDRFRAAPYPMYGKPQLRVVTEALAPEMMEALNHA